MDFLRTSKKIFSNQVEEICSEEVIELALYSVCLLPLFSQIENSAKFSLCIKRTSYQSLFDYHFVRKACVIKWFYWDLRTFGADWCWLDGLCSFLQSLGPDESFEKCNHLIALRTSKQSSGRVQKLYAIKLCFEIFSNKAPAQLAI